MSEGGSQIGTSAEITAIVTAYQRVEQTLTTLTRLKTCCPSPTEICVHVDGGDANAKKRFGWRFRRSRFWSVATASAGES